jgi:hypothetical protein
MLRRRRSLALRTLQELEEMETTTMLRKHNSDFSPVPAGAPGLVLVARRQFTAGGTIFPVGSEVPVAALGKNFAAMLASHYVAYQPPGDKPLAKRRAAPPPVPPQKNPPVVVVSDLDGPLANWRATLRGMVEKCGGDSARAKDLLMANRAASELHAVAVRSWCDGEARRLNVVSVSPSLAGIF